MRHLMALGAVVVLLGMATLGISLPAWAQEADPCATLPGGCPALPTKDAQAMGESVFTDATPTLLAAGVVPSFPSPPAALALQQVVIAPGGRITTPPDDPRVVLLYVERGTLTVRNTAAVIVTRGAVLATPGAQAHDEMPAETAFTMRAGDSLLSPAGSGGELRNDGSEEVRLLASILLPLPAGTPAATGTPVP